MGNGFYRLTENMCVPFYHVRCKSVMWLMTVGQPWDDMAYLFSRSLYKTICYMLMKMILLFVTCVYKIVEL
jgi:hypothetical protein